VSGAEIRSLIPEVRDYLASSEPEFWVASDDAGTLTGFMGLPGGKMDALFRAPEFHRRGVGRQMVRHAQALYREIAGDVNEQNTAARSVYEACGFVMEGRSELDEQGRPHPLLHLRLTA
jgi:putative acetyltransferase